MSDFLDVYIVNVLTENNNKESVLRWTTEPPTKPGLYFVFYKDIEHRYKHSGDITDWENIIKNDLGALFVEHPDDNEEFIGDYIKTAEKDGYKVYWLGPLPVPKPPDL